MANQFVMGARLNLGVSQYVSQVRSASRQTQEFRNSTDQAGRSTRDLGNSQDRASNGMGRYARETDQAGRETREFSNEARGLKGSLGGLKALIGTVFAGITVKKGFDWLVQSNADMETYENTLSIVMKSQEKAAETLAWASEFAAKTPFEIPGVIEATTRLTSYGLEAQKVLGITGDMASVMGKDLMQAVEAVADAQTGEVERLKEFGITKGMIEEQAKLLGMNPINSKGQITDMAAFNTALFSLMEERYAGGMELQSKTFKGMMSNLQDFVGTIGRKLGAPIFDAFKGQLAKVITWLEGLEESGAIDTWISNVSSAAQTAGGYISTAFTFVKDNWGTIAPVLSGVAAAFVAYRTATVVATTATKAFTTISKGINMIKGLGSMTGAFKALWGVMAANPVILIGLAIAALVGILVYAAMKSETFRAMLVNAWTNIVAFVMPAVNTVKTAILSAFTAVMTWVTTYWPKIQSIISFVWSFLGPYISTWLEFIKLAIGNTFSIIVTLITGAWDMVVAVIQTAWTVISNVVGFFLNLLTGDFEGAGQNILNIFTGLGKGIVDFFGAFGSTVWDAGVKIMETLGAGIKSAVMAPINAIKGVFEKVKEFFPASDAKKGPFSKLTFNGGKIISTMAEGVKSQAGTLQRAVGSVFNDTGVTVNPKDINPAGKPRPTAGGNTTIAKLFDTLEIHAAEGMDEETLADKVISKFYEKLSAADDVLGSADMGVLI